MRPSLAQPITLLNGITAMNPKGPLSEERTCNKFPVQSLHLFLQAMVSEIQSLREAFEAAQAADEFAKEQQECLLRLNAKLQQKVG